MPSNQIGSIAFDIISGPLPRTGLETVDLARPGVDYMGAIVMGQRGDAVEWDLIGYANNISDMNAAILAALVLKGTVVTVHDNWSLSVTNVKVDDIGFDEPKSVMKDGATAVRVTGRARLHKIQ